MSVEGSRDLGEEKGWLWRLMEVTTVNVNAHGSGVFSDHLVRISTIGYCIEYETFESALGIGRVGFVPVERVSMVVC